MIEDLIGKEVISDKAFGRVTVPNLGPARPPAGPAPALPPRADLPLDQRFGPPPGAPAQAPGPVVTGWKPWGDRIVNPPLGPMFRGSLEATASAPTTGIPELDRAFGGQGLTPDGKNNPSNEPAPTNGFAIPRVPMAGKPGDAMLRPELAVNVVPPPWSGEAFSSQVQQNSFLCGGVVWYQTWFTVQTIQVPDDSLFIIEGLGLEIPGIAIGDIVQVQVLRDMDMLVPTFETCKVSNAPNPANQLALGSIGQEVPISGIARPGQQISIRVKIVGPEDNSKTETDPINTTVRSTLYGGRAPLAQLTDGARKAFLGGERVGR